MTNRTNPGGEAAEMLTRSEVQNELVSFLKLLDSKVIGLFLQTNRNCLKRADFVQIRSARCARRWLVGPRRLTLDHSYSVQRNFK